MDDKQTKLLAMAIGALVLALGIWWFFGAKGPKNGVADLPKPPNRAMMPAQGPNYTGQNQPSVN